MATFAIYLSAAMMQLNPPSDWDDILAVALQKLGSTWRRRYYAVQLRKSLIVGLRFGIINELSGKYYLNEYGIVDNDGNVRYDFTPNLFTQLADVTLDEENVALNRSLFGSKIVPDVMQKWRRVGWLAKEQIFRTLCDRKFNINDTTSNESQNAINENAIELVELPKECDEDVSNKNEMTLTSELQENTSSNNFNCDAVLSKNIIEYIINSLMEVCELTDVDRSINIGKNAGESQEDDMKLTIGSKNSDSVNMISEVDSELNILEKIEYQNSSIPQKKENIYINNKEILEVLQENGVEIDESFKNLLRHIGEVDFVNTNVTSEPYISNLESGFSIEIEENKDTTSQTSLLQFQTEKTSQTSLLQFQTEKTSQTSLLQFPMKRKLLEDCDRQVKWLRITCD